MNAAERWERHCSVMEGATSDDALAESRRSFAVRGDGALVIFDEDGWFTMEWRSSPDSGVPARIAACDPDGRIHEVYCEPIWLATYFDEVRGS